jgi:hypothetical protein
MLDVYFGDEECNRRITEPHACSAHHWTRTLVHPSIYSCIHTYVRTHTYTHIHTRTSELVIVWGRRRVHRGLRHASLQLSRRLGSYVLQSCLTQQDVAGLQLHLPAAGLPHLPGLHAQTVGGKGGGRGSRNGKGMSA